MYVYAIEVYVVSLWLQMTSSYFTELDEVTNESKDVTLDTSMSPTSPRIKPLSSSPPLLFEHFMVIGPSDAVGMDKAHEVKTELTSSKRLSQRIGNMLRRSLSSPNAATLMTSLSAKKSVVDASGIEVDSSILFRFPDDADPPPPEVCDFCLPLGIVYMYILYIILYIYVQYI
jgi:hypothetical protein